MNEWKNERHFLMGRRQFKIYRVANKYTTTKLSKIVLNEIRFTRQIKESIKHYIIIRWY